MYAVAIWRPLYVPFVCMYAVAIWRLLYVPFVLCCDVRARLATFCWLAPFTHEILDVNTSKWKFSEGWKGQGMPLDRTSGIAS